MKPSKITSHQYVKKYLTIDRVLMGLKYLNIFFVTIVILALSYKCKLVFIDEMIIIDDKKLKINPFSYVLSFYLIFAVYFILVIWKKLSDRKDFSTEKKYEDFGLAWMVGAILLWVLHSSIGYYLEIYDPINYYDEIKKGPEMVLLSSFISTLNNVALLMLVKHLQIEDENLLWSWMKSWREKYFHLGHLLFIAMLTLITTFTIYYFVKDNNPRWINTPEVLFSLFTLAVLGRFILKTFEDRSFNELKWGVRGVFFITALAQVIKLLEHDIIIDTIRGFASPFFQLTLVFILFTLAYSKVSKLEKDQKQKAEKQSKLLELVNETTQGLIKHLAGIKEDFEGDEHKSIEAFLKEYTPYVYDEIKGIIDIGSGFAIGFIDKSQKYISIPVLYNEDEKEEDEKSKIDDSSKFHYLAINEKKEIFENNYHKNHNKYKHGKPKSDISQSIIMLPIYDKSGEEPVGIISVQSNNADAYQDIHLGIIRSLGQILSVVWSYTQSINRAIENQHTIKEQSKLLDIQRKDMSHTTKNSLTAVSSFIQTALDENTNNIITKESLKELLVRIYATSSLHHLLHDPPTYIYQTYSEGKKRDFSLDSYLKKVITDGVNLVYPKKIDDTIDTDYDSTYSVYQTIGRILTEFIINACKYSGDEIVVVNVEDDRKRSVTTMSIQNHDIDNKFDPKVFMYDETTKSYFLSKGTRDDNDDVNFGLRTAFSLIASKAIKGKVVQLISQEDKTQVYIKIEIPLKG